MRRGPGCASVAMPTPTAKIAPTNWCDAMAAARSSAVAANSTRPPPPSQRAAAQHAHAPSTTPIAHTDASTAAIAARSPTSRARDASRTRAATSQRDDDPCKGRRHRDGETGDEVGVHPVLELEDVMPARHVDHQLADGVG